MKPKKKKTFFVAPKIVNFRGNRAQIISMDFVMTFAVYIFVLSIFFFALKGNFTDTTNLDINAELIFNKLTNAYDLKTDILEGAKLVNFDAFLDTYDPHTGYDIFFKDFESPNFKKTDYCVFLQDDTDVVMHFAAYREDFNAGDYMIYLSDTIKCGSIPGPVLNAVPNCNVKESVVIEKPILYNHKIMKLKVLVCAE